MSFETVLAISLTTEVVVISVIVLTLLNAFSDGYLVAAVLSLWGGVPAKKVPASDLSFVGLQEGTLEEAHDEHETALRHAA